LPYTLRWSFVVTAIDKPNVSQLFPSGDFLGRGIWTFEQDKENPEYCNIVYDWKISAEKTVASKTQFFGSAGFFSQSFMGDEKRRREP